jgi:hypothetical protein
MSSVFVTKGRKQSRKGADGKRRNKIEEKKAFT